MGLLCANIARDLGISFAEVDEMLWAHTLNLIESWNEAPPLHVMVAGYLGVGKKTSGSVTPSSEDEVRAFAEAFHRG